MTASIRDLIYFDFEKAASIWSQLSGGLRERVSETDDRARGHTPGASVKLRAVAQEGKDHLHAWLNQELSKEMG